MAQQLEIPVVNTSATLRRCEENRTEWDHLGEVLGVQCAEYVDGQRQSRKEAQEAVERHQRIEGLRAKVGLGGAA